MSAVVFAAASGTLLAAPPIQQLGEIVVIGVTPLPGLDLLASQVPLNTQSAQADDVAEMHGQSLTGLLQQNFQGVSVTSSQGNPWQGNLYFHGYTLSPLQGSPSGMSIYMDGVRQNEPFAETMNWDAIPDFAIRNVTLIPSSNPLYGLNTLGGALVLSSKSGFSDPGGSFEVSGGSWGRIQTDADFGVHNSRFGFYAGISSDYETGWRDYSPSRVQQAFVRFDWRPNEATAFTLSYVGAHGKLYGTQTIPVEWADTPETAFTWPDFAINNLSQYNLRGSHQFGNGWSLQVGTYLRLSQTRSFDSNTNDYDSHDPGDGPLGYSPDGPFDPDSLGRYYYAGVTPPYDSRDPAATLNNVVASNVLGNVHTRGYGGSAQVVDDGNPWGHENHFTLGVSLDAGNTRFDQFGQPAFFPHTAVLRGDTLGLLPFDHDLMTAAATGVRNVGVYFLDAMTLTDALHLTVGGRYDHSSVDVSDLAGKQPGIDGRNNFHRFNPGVGLTWALSRSLGAYLNYDEGMRTPTPIELECADPGAPCALPNDFTGDPPLKPVVAHTLGGGLRGTYAGGRGHWNFSPWYSRASNDILTIFTGGSSQGYFANVPKTVRKGVDLGAGGQVGRLEWQANYSFVDATYGASFEEQSGDNSSADNDGVISVHSGDRIPGIPRQAFTLAGEYHFTPWWSFGGNLRVYPGQYAVGDENNRDDHGRVPGYAVLDLDLHWQATVRLSFFAQVQNAFDRHYFASGQLSDNVFDTPNRLIGTSGPGTSTLFVAPGAPRGWFVGMSYHFGGEGQ
jgi:outer membrane receptor protein involved in Fe transport